MSHDLIRPRLAVSGTVFASPHSGREYPQAFLDASVLDARAIRSSEDAFVDELIGAAPALGVPLVLARVPRAYVDLNRAADELDPALVEGARRSAMNPRITSGLGVVPRVVANGRAIYAGKLPLAEVLRRLERHWHPYHAALRGLLAEQAEAFGRAILIDCHSMPHEAIEGTLPRSGRLPDVVLGDRFGAAADPEVVEAIAAAFADEGLVVARNAPFAGAYITQAYGRPSQGWHVVQIELDRALYMDEARLEKRADFPAVQAMMTRVMARVVDLGRSRLPLAAE